MRAAVHESADALEESAVTIEPKIALGFMKSWLEYKPHRDILEVVGIDSSFNKPQISGFLIGAVSCVAENVECREYYSEHKIVQHQDLSEVSRELECKAIRELAPRKEVHLLIVDGSIFSFLTNANFSRMLEPVMQYLRSHKVIFLSKTSNAKSALSKDLPCSDIFYYNRLTQKSGFTSPVVDTSFGRNKKIISSYIRLDDFSPVLKLEMLASDDPTELKNDPTIEICKTLDKMAETSVDGYPMAMRYAHEDCKISGDDIDEIEAVWGCSYLTTSREPLN